MATQVKIKRRTADATAPSGLTAGEMAINLVDKKLYVGGTAGTNVIFLDSTSSVGLGTANTFTALQTFSAGANFTGLIDGASGAAFNEDITVNGMRVGLGGGKIDSNVAVGSGAFDLNTSGNRNVAVGQYALYENTEGSSNVSVGRSALTSNTEGSYNVGVGRNALNANTTGSGNVGVGAYALGEENTSGSDNVAVGSSALGNNTTGSNKTALGTNAGQYRGTGTDTNTTGTGGIYIGYQARGSTNAQTNEIVIGVDALGLGSHTAVIGATLQSAATIYGVLNLPSGLSASGATFNGNISAPNIVTRFNGATGAVTGVGTAVAGTGISVSGATGAVTITNTGVQTFNGLTGAVTGASLGANTFTALNTFSAGISASGATFNGTVNIGTTALISAPSATALAIQSQIPAGTGVTPTIQIICPSAGYTLTNGTATQPVFASAIDTITLQASTSYMFDGQYILQTGTTSHFTSMSFVLTTATITNMTWYVLGTAGNGAGSQATSQTTTFYTSNSGGQVIGSSTNSNTIIKFEGIMRVNVGGTMVPNIAFSAAPGGTNLTLVGSYLRFYPIGSNTIDSVGTAIG